ncbi:arginine-hydroxylase NDUFAF5, mitochondrial [Venturia canescens]|uniref:arginine-hydroxylase NDUFAF5, mitochondrial n=1 Tax=Venturia canescens TaxID=32260 RepID=UPI001C9D1843|nr:arginine-hydroxylase NDUFAF5, mitochondrial [Venturia canescens]
MALTMSKTLFQNRSTIITRALSSSSSCLHLQRDSVMNVFDRNAKLLQRERAARASNVKLYDYLKDEVGYRLADRIFDIKREFKTALDLGCGRGHVAKNILRESVEKLILIDMCSSFVEQAESMPDLVVERKVMDEENFVFDENSLDLVVSCLSLHWVNDLPGCFSRIIHSLKNDGVFMAAIFGGDTLYELRSSLQLAELERDGGISPHISPFTQIRDIGSLLNRAGFTMLTIDTDELVIGFPSMFELMWDLKGMGESNAARNRKLHLKRETMIAAAAIYEELYGKTKDDGSTYVPATFQIIYMLGWKPDRSQPKPLERGTGEISLKDLYKLDQIIRDKKKIKLTDEDN